MRKILLLTTALATSLAFASVAGAQSSTTSGDTMSEEPTAPTKIDGGAKTGDSTSGAADMSAGTDSSYGSYNRTETFTGTISGGFEAANLIGKDVVDSEGNIVGEVTDLLIGAGNKVDSVLVDAGGFLGFGSKRVAVGLDQLTVSKDGLQTSMTEEEIEALPAYEENDQGWSPVERESESTTQ